MRKNSLFAIAALAISTLGLALFGCVGSRSPETGVLEGLSITPGPGEILPNSDNRSSEIVLKNIRIDKVLSDKQYFSPWYPPNTVKQGENILVARGTVKNNGLNPEITIYAIGLDVAGNQVLWTLDQSGIAGRVGLHLGKGDTGEFTLHMNYSEAVKSIHIFADTYQTAPP